MPPFIIRILSGAVLLLSLGCFTGHSAPVPTGNWSDVTFTDTATTGRLLSFERPTSSYICFLDDVVTGQQRIAASLVTVSSTTNVHVEWSSRGWTFDGTLSGDSNSLSGLFTTSGVPVSVSFQRQPSVDDCLQSSYTDGSGTLPYRLFVARNYQATNSYPLMIFLHGGSEGGADNRIQLTGHVGVFNFISKTNQVLHPCFLAAPQAPFGADLDDSIRRAQIMGMLNKIKTQYNIDTNRIYITGVSLGGAGSWDQITRFPSVYAAAIPMSGYGTTSLVAAITNVAVWNFHGTNDSIVPVTDSQHMIDSARRAGARPIYTEYGSGNHGVWIPAYYTPGLVEWTFAQRRGQRAIGSPFISITTPTTNATYGTSSTNLALSGIAGNTNALVRMVRAWNTRNNAMITASGTNDWALDGLRLRTNTNNLIVVTAYGTTWMPRWGGSTTFNTTVRVTEVETPMVLTISATESDAILQWTGGIAPYVVQGCPDPTEGNWSNIRTTSQTTVSIPLETNAVFYRVSVQ